MSEKLRIFLSSPGDVGLERDLAERVVERLQGEFGARLTLETIRWEDRPVRATDSFQPQIIPPSQTDIVVVILWSRLGTPLSEVYKREDGTRYGSGTEWEFEDAVRAYHAKGLPDILVYKRDEAPLASLRDPDELEKRRRQYDSLESFVQRWFFSEDGSFKAAFKVYQVPDAFERLLESDLRRLIEERLPDHVSDEARPEVRWHRGSPYLGLSSFDLEHAPVFFGRTRAISEIRDALVRQSARGCASLIVFGMSGCGKSSLVRAGVLGTITRPGVVEDVADWRWCGFRPSDITDASLCRGLAAAITGETALPELTRQGVTVDSLESAFQEAPKHAVTPLGMALRSINSEPQAAAEANVSSHAKARLIVVIDQLEEIFTLEQFDAEQRQSFVRALEGLARSGLVWVIATMRSDFYPRCLEIPELVSLKEGDGQYDLLPPTFDEIGQMIEFPTRAAGLQFEVDPDSGQRLDAMLHEAAAKDPQALPLLSFTLDELYRRRSEDGILTIKAYKSLGGMEGALAQRAEEVFAAQEPAVQNTLPALLRGLVTVDPAADNIVAARRVLQDDLAISSERRTMLSALIDARLLVTDRAEDGSAVVRVAHEALLTHRPRVQSWLEDDRDFLRIRSRLDQAADRWRLDGRRADLLLPAGKALAEAEDALATRRDDLSGPVIEFVSASQRRRKRRRVTQFSVTAIVGAIVTAVGIWGYNEWQDWQTGIAQADERTKAADQKSRAAELEAMRVDYAKFANDARAEMLDPLPVDGPRDRAIEKYLRCIEIAKELSTAGTEDERKLWTSRYLEQLANLADAHAAKNDIEGMNKAMLNRQRVLESLPPELQGVGETNANTEFSYHRGIVMQLQFDLAVANELIKYQLRGNKPPTEIDEVSAKIYEGLISNLTLLADSTGKPEDLKYVADANAFYGKALYDVKQFEEAEKYYRRAAEAEKRRLEVQLERDFNSAERFSLYDRASTLDEYGERSASPFKLPSPRFPPVNLELMTRGDAGLYFDPSLLPKLIVLHVIKDSSAARSQQIGVGDEILRAAEGDTGDWIPANEENSLSVRKLMFGPPGETIRVEVKPAESEETKVLSLVRTNNWRSFNKESGDIAYTYSIRLYRLAFCSYKLGTV